MTLYDKFLSEFRADDMAAMLSGDLETGVNACLECCDRHAQSDRVALDHAFGGCPHRLPDAHGSRNAGRS